VLDILPALSSTPGDPMSSSNSASQILLDVEDRRDCMNSVETKVNDTRKNNIKLILYRQKSDQDELIYLWRLFNHPHLLKPCSPF